MMRRQFLLGTLSVAGASLLSEVGMGLQSDAAIIKAPIPKTGITNAKTSFSNTKSSVTSAIDVQEFHRMRRFADLPMSRVAYIERGKGQVALFLHGFPLNGYQWRGAIERLSPYRRCITADFMGLGYTETPEHQDISPVAQVEMLAAFLDHLKINQVDLVANDSGGLVAQLFVAHHPSRVRTLLLTNCDVDENNPPEAFKPLIEAAKRGTVADKFIAPQVADKNLARSDKGLGVAYTYPDKLADETIDCDFAPLVSSPLRKQQFVRYTTDFEPNLLVAIRPQLKQFNKPTRMVWATSDIFFDVKWAEWLDETLPGTLGVRRVEGAKLFFPEEMPDIISEEALKLWGVPRVPGGLM
jgi:haloalkane dehalogenase